MALTSTAGVRDKQAREPVWEAKEGEARRALGGLGVYSSSNFSHC